MRLESESIDYESIAKFNQNISATLLNIQPIPFEGVNFGDQSVLNMSLSLFGEDSEERLPEMEEFDFDVVYSSVMIKNLTVKVKQNIPIYVFTLEIPAHYDGKYLYRNLKSKLSFEFNEMGEGVLLNRGGGNE